MSSNADGNEKRPVAEENIIVRAARAQREVWEAIEKQDAEIERLRAENTRLRGLITQMVDAYDFRVDGVISADDYLMGVLDLLREEARRD